MDRYGYVLKQKTAEEKSDRHYRREELLLMTVFQLREICRREKIIQGIINPMDKEELIRTILRFRGEEECFLIERHNQEGVMALERILKETRLREKHDRNLQCNSTIIAYEGTASPCPMTNS